MAQRQTKTTWKHYDVADYNRAVRTLRAFRDALELHFL